MADAAGNPFVSGADAPGNPFAALSPNEDAPGNPFAGPAQNLEEPDMAPMQKWFLENLQKEKEEKAAQAATETRVNQEVTEADTFLESLDAGWQMSVSGLIKRGQMPTTVLPEHAPMYMKIASQISTLAGDLPAMVAGSMAGAEAGAVAGGAGGAVIGSVIPGAGTAAGAAAGAAGGGVVGGGYGAFALPEAIRQSLMSYYEKGTIQNFEDFWSRSAAVFIEANKQGVVGAATMGVGGAVGKVASKTILPTAAQTTAKLSSEVATMVTVGKAIEGQVPNASDFVEAAIMVGGLHGSAKVAGKLRQRYAATGQKPSEIALEAETNPVLKQELLNEVQEKPVIEGKIQVEPVATEPAPGPKPEPVAQPSAVDKIMSQVGEKQSVPKEKPSFDEFYRKFVDKYDPIKVVTEKLSKGKELEASENPYTIARLVNDYKSKVRHVIEHGTLDFKTLEKSGKGLKEIIEPHKAEVRELEAYLISKRAIEIEASGRKSGFDLTAANEVVKSGAKFEKTATELVDFQNRNLQYLRDSGRISNETYKTLVDAGKSYIPFSRVFEASEATGKGKSNPLKRLKGSDKQIQSPFRSIIENAETTFKIAEQNRAKVVLVELAEKSGEMKGENAIIEKVPGKSKAIEISESEMKSFFEEHGIEATPETMTVFRGAHHELSPTEFEVFRNGKREVYKTEKPLAEAIKSLEGDPTATNVLFKLARGITTIKKLGISLTPDFILRNIIRDQITASTFSKTGSVPFTQIVGAVGHLVKKDTVYQNWLKSGGANGAFMELNNLYLERNVFELSKKTGNWIDSARNVVSKPFEILAVTGNLADQATRLAEFKRVTKGASSGSKIFEGGYASREITVDFQRIGAKMSALNAITAFQNVSIQGFDRTARAFKDDPSGLAMKATAYITLPSVLLWWANKDDPRYQEIPRSQKDFFWIIPTDNWVEVDDPGMAPEHLVRQQGGKTYVNQGVIYRIPKPQELGLIFGSLVERGLEAFFQDNPKAMKEFEETMVELVTPSLVPDAVVPPFEQYMNKSFFTGRPIVSAPAEKLLPEDQYNEYTSATAKQLGKMIAAVPGQKENRFASPMILENYVRAWTGTLGMYALQVADKSLETAGVTAKTNKPASTLSDIPFVKAFAVRYPSSGAQSIQDFYEKAASNEKYINSRKNRAKLGEFDQMSELMAEYEEKMLSPKGMKEALSIHSQLIQKTYLDPSMGPEEKRQLIDSLYYSMIEMAKLGNEMSDSLESAIEEDKKEKTK